MIKLVDIIFEEKTKEEPITPIFYIKEKVIFKYFVFIQTLENDDRITSSVGPFLEGNFGIRWVTLAISFA